MAITRKQICLAGFPENEIERVQPMLTEISTAWQCVFAPESGFVLTMLKELPFDAVVADLRGLGLSTAELFEKIAVKHPRTLRFALGDFADREAVANSIGAPYQFVSRPWKLAELIRIVERSLSLDAWLANDKLRSFAPRLGQLPHLSTTYFQVVKTAESPNATVDSVAEVIAHDPALTARLLQTANSAVCGRSEKVTTPAGAVSVLGMDTVKSLVLCLQLFTPPPAGNKTLPLEALWRLSFATAQRSRQIALLQTGDSGLASDAFTAGLLHRIGQVVLVTNLPEEYETVLASIAIGDRSLQEAEKAHLGVTSDQVSAYLLGLWGMPLPLVETAALWRKPSASDAREFSVLAAVHIAAAVAFEEHAPLLGLPQPNLDRTYLEALDLPWKIEVWRKHLSKNQAASPISEPTEQAGAAAPARALFGTRRKSRLIGTVAILAAVALLSCLAFLFRSPLPLTKRSPSPGTAVPKIASGTPVTESNPDAPSTRPKVIPASALDAIRVEGIFDRAGQPAAMINGRTVRPGERIGELQVISIDRRGVVLEFRGERRSFNASEAGPLHP
jgi:HD-like signal output (HDOD) protein